MNKYKKIQDLIEVLLDDKYKIIQFLLVGLLFLFLFWWRTRVTRRIVKQKKEYEIMILNKNFDKIIANKTQCNNKIEDNIYEEMQKFDLDMEFCIAEVFEACSTKSEIYRLDIKNKMHHRIEDLMEYPKVCKSDNNNIINDFFLFDCTFTKIGKIKFTIKPKYKYLGYHEFIIYNHDDQELFRLKNFVLLFDKEVGYADIIKILPIISRYYESQIVYITADNRDILSSLSPNNSSPLLYRDNSAVEIQ